jgi:hypothetical protein
MKQVKHWQDPVSAVLGVCFVLSPWAIGFYGDTVATANAVIIGLALVATSLGAILFPRAWEDYGARACGPTPTPSRRSARPRHLYVACDSSRSTDCEAALTMAHSGPLRLIGCRR